MYTQYTHSYIYFIYTNTYHPTDTIAHISHSPHTAADAITRCSIYPRPPIPSHGISTVLPFFSIVCNPVCAHIAVVCSSTIFSDAVFPSKTTENDIWLLFSLPFFSHFSDPYSYRIAIAFWLHRKCIYTYTAHTHIYKYNTVYCVYCVLLYVFVGSLKMTDDANWRQNNNNSNNDNNFHYEKT